MIGVPEKAGPPRVNNVGLIGIAPTRCHALPECGVHSSFLAGTELGSPAVVTTVDLVEPVGLQTVFSAPVASEGRVGSNSQSSAEGVSQGVTAVVNAAYIYKAGTPSERLSAVPDGPLGTLIMGHACSAGGQEMKEISSNIGPTHVGHVPNNGLRVDSFFLKVWHLLK